MVWGISLFKIFLVYKGVFGIDDMEFYWMLKLVVELDVIVIVYCENEILIVEWLKELFVVGKIDLV